MSDKSAIEWTDSTWNPIRGIPPNRWMCRKISPGCDHCYASTMNARFGGIGYPQAPYDVAVRLDEKALMLPLSWRAPRRVFVCSMTDLFGEWMPDETIDQVFGIMAMAGQHQFQVLTKRPARMRAAIQRLHDKFASESPFLQAITVPGQLRARTEVGWAIGSALRTARTADDPFALDWPLPNVWLGTSIELDRFVWRANVLRECPAAVRFVSAEPLLGPLPRLDLTGVDWLITGGESGAHHRPLELDWVRDLRDRCTAQHVAFFHKQHGCRTHAAGGRELDGRTWSEFPDPVGVAP